MGDPRVVQVVNQLRLIATRVEIAATMPPSVIRRLRFRSIRSELRQIEEGMAALEDSKEAAE